MRGWCPSGSGAYATTGLPLPDVNFSALVPSDGAAGGVAKPTVPLSVVSSLSPLGARVKPRRLPASTTRGWSESSPASPLSPLAPAGPVSPLAPAGPVSPFAPCAPVLPPFLIAAWAPDDRRSSEIVALWMSRPRMVPSLILLLVMRLAAPAPVTPTTSAVTTQATTVRDMLDLLQSL